MYVYIILNVYYVFYFLEYKIYGIFFYENYID